MKKPEFNKEYKLFISNILDDNIGMIVIIKELEMTLNDFVKECYLSTERPIDKVLGDKGLPDSMTFTSLDDVEVVEETGYGDEDVVMTMQKRYHVNLHY